MENTPLIKYSIKEKFEKLTLRETQVIKAKYAIIFGCSQRTFERDLEGISTIPAERLQKWAKVLKCEISELFNDGIAEIILPETVENELGLNR